MWRTGVPYTLRTPPRPAPGCRCGAVCARPYLRQHRRVRIKCLSSWRGLLCQLAAVFRYFLQRSSISRRMRGVRKSVKRWGAVLPGWMCSDGEGVGSVNKGKGDLRRHRVAAGGCGCKSTDVVPAFAPSSLRIHACTILTLNRDAASYWLPHGQVLHRSGRNR